MNNETIFFLIYGILCAVFGFASKYLYGLITGIMDHYEKRRTLPCLVEASADTVCKGPHSWNKAKLVFPELPVDTYSVCTDCGYIAAEDEYGFSYQLNKPGLEVYNNNIKLKAEDDQKIQTAFKAYQAKTQEIMNAQIRAHVGLLGTDLQTNIEVLQQFFRKSDLELKSLYIKSRGE